MPPKARFIGYCFIAAHDHIRPSNLQRVGSPETMTLLLQNPPALAAVYLVSIAPGVNAAY